MAFATRAPSQGAVLCVHLQYHGELKNIAGPGTPGSKIVREARDAISKEIATQAPDYVKVMKDYDEASDAWKLVPGNYVVRVGGSSQDLPLQQSVSF